jgi:hypothetical protein
MTHPSDTYNDRVLTSNSPAGEPPAQHDSPAPQDAAPLITAQPSDDHVAVLVPVAQPEMLERNFDRQAAESFRMATDVNANTVHKTVTSSADSFRAAVSSNTEKVVDVYAASTESYEAVSQALRASAEEFASGFTQLNLKLFEFGRLNAQSSLDYVRGVSSARTMRDLVDVQTAYMRGQYDALTRQMRELQTLTTELAGKTAAPLKQQITRATQLSRIC